MISLSMKNRIISLLFLVSSYIHAWENSSHQKILLNEYSTNENMSFLPENISSTNKKENGDGNGNWSIDLFSQHHSGSLKVTNLKKFIKKYLTIYLTSSSSFVGSDLKVNEVYAVLASEKISAETIMVPSQKFNYDPDNILLVPNHLVVVIHSSEKHALNRYNVSVGPFEQPIYKNGINPVNFNQETRKFIIKNFFDYNLIETNEDRQILLEVE